jgi:hypothetical protein
MASEWLQLDATDDWVRHDSGVVSFRRLFGSALPTRRA